MEIKQSKISELDFSVFFNINLDLLCIADTDGNFIKVNKEWEKLLGYPVEEIQKRKFLEFVHPDDIPDTINSIKQLDKQKEVLNFTNRYQCKDGSYRYIQWRSKPYGKIIYAAARDVTEQKMAEEKLRESETNFRTFFDTIDDMIFIGNQQGEIFYTNNAAIRKLGYSSEEFSNMHVLEVHPSEKRNEAEQIFAEMFAGKKEVCPLPFVRKDGTLLPVETRVWFGKWNGTNCIFGISKDLSKEQEAFQKFNRIFEGNPAPMALNSIYDRKFIEVNNAFLRILGYSRDEVIGKSSTELDLFVKPEQQEEVRNKLKATGSIHNIELQLMTKSGVILDGLFSGEIIETQGKKYFLTVMLDITDKKETENELKKQAGLISSLLDSIPDIIFFKDIKGTYLGCNPQFSEFVGKPREEIIGRTDYDLFEKDVADFFR